MSLLTILASGDPTPTQVVLSSVGTLGANTVEVVDGLTLSGTGTLSTSTTYMAMSDTGALSGTGTVAMATETIIVLAEMRMEVLDDTLERAPTVVTVTVFQALPNTDVQFQIDGVLVHTQEADSEGNLYAVPLPVAGTLLAGTHTITCVQAGSMTGTATFTLAADPIPDDSGPGEDVPPADPGVVARWVLQDPIAGGLGNYVLPHNPDSWVPPFFERRLTVRHTTAKDGQYHLIEGQEMVAEWSFSGFCSTQAMYDALVAFKELQRRFYVIDHRGDAWVTTFVDIDITPRTRKTIFGTPSDWGHDYTVTAVAYWQTPAVIA